MGRRFLGAVLLAVVIATASVTGVAAAAKAPAPTGRYIVVLKAGAPPFETAVAQSKQYGAEVDNLYNHALGGYSATIPVAKVNALRADPRVADVVEETTFTASACVGPICGYPQLVPAWGRRIGTPLSAAHSGDGQGEIPINVAVIDTGIQLDQPDLNVVGGVDCGSGPGYDDVQGHGTFIGGIIGALDNTYGRVGIVPGARLWSVRSFSQNGSATTSQVLCGFEWVMATRTDADPTNDIQVANLSFVGPFPKGDDEQCGLQVRDVIHQAICRGTALGINFVAGAGNSAVDVAQQIPASYREVLTMTAMTDSDGNPGALGGADLCYGYADETPAGFSNFATLSVDQVHTSAAPGVCMHSTYIGSDETTWSGTSFAAPVGAGLVALCIATGPCAGLTPAQIVAKMVGDAATYNAAHPTYGFTGDPAHPIPGKYYGNLMSAARFSDDHSPPALTVPGDMTVAATGPSGAVVTYTATATDDLDPAPVVSCAPPSGSTFPIGATLVQCNATDAASNVTNRSFTVYVVTTTVSALSDVHAWIGLKTSADQGTKFDLQVELLNNGVPVAAAIQRCIAGVNNNPAAAVEAVVPWNAFNAVPLKTGDLVSIRVSARVGTNPDDTRCTGPGASHANATGLTVYYDGTTRPTRAGGTISPAPAATWYLRSDGGVCAPNGSVGVTARTLSTTAPNAAAKCVNSTGVNFAGGNPWAPVATWSLPPQL